MERYGLNDGDLEFLPGEINSGGEGLEAQFRALFGSDAAKKAMGVVYFFLSQHPVPRVKGASRILYIGKTTSSLYMRYFPHVRTLASKRSGKFYQHILDDFGVITIGYLKSAVPVEDERTFFKRYVGEHLEYPPKSKVG